MNIELLDKISSPGSLERPNEDLIIIDDGLVVVLDGATGLGGGFIKDEESDAKWFVQQISEKLPPAWKRSNNFKWALRSSLKIIGEQFVNLTRECNISKHELPSSGMIAVALEKGKINLYQAGDCTAIYNGIYTEKLFENSKLEELDKSSIKVLRRFMDDGLSYSEARKNILPILRSHREMMNTKEGYSALSVGIESLNFIETKHLCPASGDKLLLTSDGFSAIYNKYDFYQIDWFFVNQNNSLKVVVNLLRLIELLDKNLLKYPRLKLSDDATAVLLKFENCL